MVYTKYCKFSLYSSLLDFFFVFQKKLIYTRKKEGNFGESNKLFYMDPKY